VILWVNGPFGAGKTTLATLLAERIPDAHLFDSETVGYLLQRVLNGPRPVGDFQDWRAWRTLVVETVAALQAELPGATIVIPQSVYVEQYWRELAEGMAARGLEVRAITLDVEAAELERRIRSDTVEFAAVDWRLEKMAAFAAARNWLARDTEMVDASGRSPQQLAEYLAP